MRKIAISGKANTGKNTFIDFLTNELEKRQWYATCAFADKIKETVEFWFPKCDSNSLYGASELRQNKIKTSLNLPIDQTYRQICLDVGKIGRSYNPKFWIAHLELNYLEAKNKGQSFYITDLRFPEELEWVKQEGFTLLRIKRDSVEKMDELSENIQDLIPDSEFDYVIDNDSDLPSLQRVAKKIAASLMK